MKFEKKLAFTVLQAEVHRIGRDFQILLWGGERPHIGCTVLAVPRESLRKDGTGSCTSSVLNVVGHKDELLCRHLAERISSGCRAVVSCSGGVHMDSITMEQIKELQKAVWELGEEIYEEAKALPTSHKYDRYEGETTWN